MTEFDLCYFKGNVVRTSTPTNTKLENIKIPYRPGDVKTGRQCVPFCFFLVPADTSLVFAGFYSL